MILRSRSQVLPGNVLSFRLCRSCEAEPLGQWVTSQSPVTSVFTRRRLGPLSRPNKAWIGRDNGPILRV